MTTIYLMPTKCRALCFYEWGDAGTQSLTLLSSEAELYAENLPGFTLAHG